MSDRIKLIVKKQMARVRILVNKQSKLNVIDNNGNVSTYFQIFTYARTFLYECTHVNILIQQ